ncbi:unnamed protein product [Trichogramma brassicae]|uniref:Endonuclease/exonuclease/phosphatase domain-containing protein n=1 Tax=Trichogramma brassicae TaxID=86971 RepID=A0A6H5IW74_9HYME|nr:unnamed protein product [Trichogramma brassicae]
MTRVLQLNLNHCMAAQSLLMQSVKKMKIDVAILSDQQRDLRSLHTWISDADSQVAIWVREGVPVQRRTSGQSRFYTWAQIAGIYFFSVYAPPRLSIGKFASLLASIVDEARGKKPVLLAGDFNAWSIEWGSSESRPRGEMLLAAILPLDVLLLNTGSRSTFVGPQEGSVIDLTFASDTLSERVNSWRVSDAYTGSDHRAIVFEVLPAGNRCSNPAPASRRKWSARTMEFEFEFEI